MTHTHKHYQNVFSFYICIVRKPTKQNISNTKKHPNPAYKRRKMNPEKNTAETTKRERERERKKTHE